MVIRIILLLCLCICAVFPEIPKDSAQLIDMNKNGILNINVYPPEATIFLNDHYLGKGKVSVENLRPGYYKVTCHNKNKVTEELIKIYPGLASDVKLSAVVPYFTASFGISSIAGNRTTSLGPNIEIGYGFEHHYLGFNYCWSTSSPIKTILKSGPYNGYLYGIITEPISGTMDTTIKMYESFIGGSLVYLNKGNFTFGWIEFDPGFVVGYFAHSIHTDYSYQFHDSTGSGINYDYYFSPYSTTKILEHIFGPTLRVCLGPKKVNAVLNYSYLFGKTNGQLISTNLQIQF